MPIYVNWYDDEQRIMHWVFEGEWDLDDYRQKLEAAWQQTGHLPYIIDGIIEFRTGTFLPKGNILQHFRYSFDKAPMNAGLVVFTGENAIQRHFFKVYSTFYQRLTRKRDIDITWADDVDHALALIAQKCIERQQHTA